MIEPVDLQDQSIDLEIQFVQMLHHLFAVCQRFLERLEFLSQRRRWQAVFGDLMEKLGMRPGTDSFAITDTVTEDPQAPFGTDTGIQHPDAACGHVACVGKQRLALAPLVFVQHGQIRIGHVDLAAHLQDRWQVPASQPQGHVRDRPDIVGDVVADQSIAASQRTHEATVFVDHGHRHAVHLQLDDPLGRLSRQEFLGATAELPQLAKTVRIVDRQHRNAVFDLNQIRNRAVADPLGRAVGRDPLGMLRLDLLQPFEQPVVVQVADLRTRLDIVLAIVIADLFPQRLQFVLLCARHLPHLH